MAFSQKTWKDRLVEFAGRRKLTTVSTGDGYEVVDVARNEGSISQEGDAFSAANMNDLEQRIADEFDEVNSNLGSSVTVRYDQQNDKIQVYSNNEWVDIMTAGLSWNGNLSPLLTWSAAVSSNASIGSNPSWSYSNNTTYLYSAHGSSGATTTTSTFTSSDFSLDARHQTSLRVVGASNDTFAGSSYTQNYSVTLYRNGSAFATIYSGSWTGTTPSFSYDKTINVESCSITDSLYLVVGITTSDNWWINSVITAITLS